MSLILEALRKSEADRRRGQAPDLFTELPPVVQRSGSTLSAWHWLTLAAMLLAVLAWMTRERGSPSPGGSAISAIDTDTPADRTSRGQAAAEPPKDQASAQDAADSNDITAPDAISPAPIAPVASSPTKPTPKQESAPVAAGIVSPVQVPVTTASPPSSKPLPAPAPRVATPVPEPFEDSRPLLQLADLSAEQRRQLPPLKMSMHMWNQDPTRRFVIIDGARLGEGDRIGDAVIERITADSVVLDWNGRRLGLSLR